MLDFIAAKITPTEPESTCRVYDMQGNLKRVLPGLPEEYQTGKVDCLGRPWVQSLQLTGRMKYEWDLLLPKAFELVQAGMTLPEIAVHLDCDYEAMVWQVNHSAYGAQIRDWRAAHKKPRKKRSKGTFKKTLENFRRIKEGMGV
jgi:hypothetical protein